MSLFADAEDWQLEVGRQEWSGLAYGGRDQPPLLMLHGWLDNAGSLVPLARGLPGLRRWLPDLPGHGRSGHRPPGTWYHFVDYLSDVLALCDALGLERFDLLGHSMGGAIATLIAAACPERVRRLVLIEALGPLSRPAEAIVEDLRRAIDARLRLTEKKLRVHPDRASALAARMQAGDLDANAAEYLVERALMPVAGGYVWRSDARQTLPTPIRGTEPQMLAVLAAIQAPTQLILADPATSYLDGPLAHARIQALCPLSLHRLPGGHHLHLKEPAAVVEVVGRFLADVGDRGA